MMTIARILCRVAALLLAAACFHAGAFDIQAALDALDGRPGGVVSVPAGEHRIEQALTIKADHTVLEGSGVIVQMNPEVPVLRAEEVRDIRISGLTFTRPEGAQETQAEGIRLSGVEGAVLDRIRVLACKSSLAALAVYDSADVVIRDCEIRNYKRIAVDDRTANELHGYAFYAIDGHGLRVIRCTNVQISNNRIVEDALLPTREMQERHQLGQLTEGREPTAIGELGRRAVQDGYVSNWHQGSAILVGSPRVTRHVQVVNNHIVNAAQGIDLHCDYTLVSGNLIDHCMIGIKATHGSEGLTVTGNTITHVDLWGILLNPGELSSEDNPDRATLIANNTILAYGHGHEYWNWGGAKDGYDSYAIVLFDGQLPENPPLREVLITGNIVGGNIGPPRYRYALCMRSWHGPPEDSPNMPEDPRVEGNLLAPGWDGVSNFPNPENR